VFVDFKFWEKFKIKFLENEQKKREKRVFFCPQKYIFYGNYLHKNDTKFLDVANRSQARLCGSNQFISKEIVNLI